LPFRTERQLSPALNAVDIASVVLLRHDSVLRYGEAAVVINVQTPAGLLPLAGTNLGPSSWIEIRQDDIDLFADATRDHQWIHVDADRAKKGPFGTTIAHGYMTLSLVVSLWSELVTVERTSMTINYGLNKVRFPAPVRVGSRIRLTGTLSKVDSVEGGFQVTSDLLVEIEDEKKPACALQAVYRFYD